MQHPQRLCTQDSTGYNAASLLASTGLVLGMSEACARMGCEYLKGHFVCIISCVTHTHTHTHTRARAHAPCWILSGTTWVSQHQKGKTNLDLLRQEIVSGSGISWAVYKSAPLPRYITMPASHHSVPFLLPNQQCQSTKCKRLTESSYRLSHLLVCLSVCPKSVLWQFMFITLCLFC